MVKTIQIHGGTPIFLNNDLKKIDKLKKNLKKTNHSLAFYKVDITKRYQVKSTIFKI